MNQIFLGQPADAIKTWFTTEFPTWPTYTTLKFVDGSTQTKEINGAATLENIGVKYDDAWYENNTLTYCQLGTNVNEIDTYAFAYCYSLTSVNIPSSVTKIGYYAFKTCSSLPSISIPSSVISIGSYTFNNCHSLTSIIVDPNNTSYDSRDNCNAIIETSSNTLIHGCGNTTIPNSVTSIGVQAFFGCYSLTSIDIPNSVTEISNSTFANCVSLTSVTIPNSVTSIRNAVFAFCYSLSSIDIPSSVTSIGDFVFNGSSSLTSIIVDPNNTSYDSRDNCNAIIETSSNTLIHGCGNTTIPNSVTSIGVQAFFGCYSLTSIDIPSSVTSIGNDAFSNCSSLISVTIPSSVISIGSGAFYRCSSLTSVIFEGRISSEITAMANYPWDIPNTSAIKPGIS